MEIIENRQEQFEKYMDDILEARLKLSSPIAVLSRFYTPNNPAVKWLEGHVRDKEEEIKRKLRTEYKFPTG
jgi:hypothetical protein